MSEALIKVSNTHNNEGKDELATFSEFTQNVITGEFLNLEDMIQKEQRKRPGALGYIFPSRILRELEGLHSQQVHNRFNLFEKMVSVILEAQIDNLQLTRDKWIISKKQQYESELIEQGMDITTHLNAVSQRKLIEIGDEFERSKKVFVDRIKREQKEADTCKHIDFLYQEYCESIRFETQAFFRIIRGNIEKFEASLDISLQGALRQITKET